MTKTALLLSTALSILAVTSCENEPVASSDQQLARKNEPNEFFFLQRAYPDAHPDIAALEQGLVQARLMATAKNTGFDASWTVQGPGNIGARANTVAVNPQNENILYAGFSNGGVWKTTDGGNTWYPVFDSQLWPSIGDIEVDPANPNRVYVATGDPNISFYPMLGDGVYRSEDGGETWSNIGLQNQRVISKIVLHPSNPNILFAASMGLPFIRDNNRGLYRTTNGGASWEQVLFISDQAGVTDVVMDPFNPNVLYASGWDRVRSNKESLVSGPGAKIYRSTDGGSTWTQLTNGLPQENLGRTGLAISTQTPGKVYAMYVGTDNQLAGIYKTTNGGNNWSATDITGLEGALGGFGWYFGKIRVNPLNDEEIFLLGVDLWRGLPALGNWMEATPPWWLYEVHADKHDLVFAPSGNMYLGTDGGLYKSTDQGISWSDIENIPTTQFYRVAHNPHQPDLYYGGAQDNGTTGGNAADINNWPRIYGGDGFRSIFHPDNPLVYFVETQNGNIAVTTDGGGSYSSGDNGISFDDRRNWDMPYIMSHHNPSVMYAGTFRVYKSQVNGYIPNYSPISGDLTDGLVLHPRHHNISTLSESPLTAGLLYAGTADGNVWRTDNDGANWVNVSEGLPDRYVTSVSTSPSNPNWVYVSHSGYRDNEFIPRIHRSKDRGASWEYIGAGLPDIAVNNLHILPGHSDSVLFAATDAGVYATLNSGQSWHRLGDNMPFVPVFELGWNPVHNTLFAGTFARSILSYPIDSLLAGTPPDTTVATRPALPMREMASIFPSPAREQVTVKAPGHPFKPAEIVVLDASGKPVRMLRTAGPGNVSQTIDVAALPAGHYTVKVKSGHNVSLGRFIKQ
jgi:photosystem II stability/assembly factor-like uncharacterized protein